MNKPNKPTRKLLIGGVMRCCTDTLYTLPDEQVIEKDGNVIQCKHSPNNPMHQLIWSADAKAWKWNRLSNQP